MKIEQQISEQTKLKDNLNFKLLPLNKMNQFSHTHTHTHTQISSPIKAKAKAKTKVKSKVKALIIHWLPSAPCTPSVCCRSVWWWGRSGRGGGRRTHWGHEGRWERMLKVDKRVNAERESWEVMLRRNVERKCRENMLREDVCVILFWENMNHDAANWNEMRPRQEETKKKKEKENRRV